MKVSTLILFTVVFSLVSCTEDAVRTSISSGDATFVCVKENRTLEYERDTDSGPEHVPVKKTLSYGTCEEFRNQSKEGFEAFKTGLCSSGIAYSDTTCDVEFKKTSLKKAFDCTLQNSTRVYGVSEDTPNEKKNYLILFGKSQCVMGQIAFDQEALLEDLQ